MREPDLSSRILNDLAVEGVVAVVREPTSGEQRGPLPRRNDRPRRAMCVPSMTLDTRRHWGSKGGSRPLCGVWGVHPLGRVGGPETVGLVGVRMGFAFPHHKEEPMSIVNDYPDWTRRALSTEGVEAAQRAGSKGANPPPGFARRPEQARTGLRQGAHIEMD